MDSVEGNTPVEAPDEAAAEFAAEIEAAISGAVLFANKVLRLGGQGESNLETLLGLGMATGGICKHGRANGEITLNTALGLVVRGAIIGQKLATMKQSTEETVADEVPA